MLTKRTANFSESLDSRWTQNIRKNNTNRRDARSLPMRKPRLDARELATAKAVLLGTLMTQWVISGFGLEVRGPSQGKVKRRNDDHVQHHRGQQTEQDDDGHWSLNFVPGPLATKRERD